MPWLVQTWLERTVALGADSCESESFATDLAEFIAGVGCIDTRGRRYSGHGRGGVLADHDDGSRNALFEVRACWTSLRCAAIGKRCGSFPGETARM